MKKLIFILTILFALNLFAYFTDTVNQERGGRFSMPISLFSISSDSHHFDPGVSIGVAYGLAYDFAIKANLFLPTSRNSSLDYSGNILVREDVNFDRRKRFGFFFEGGGAVLGENEYFFPLKVAVKYSRRFGQVAIGSSALVDFCERNPVSIWLGIDFIASRFMVVSVSYDRFISDEQVIRDLLNLTLKIKF